MQLRQRFLYCTHLNEKVGDVPAPIKKSLSEYRFWGMGLHQWKRFGLAAFCLALSAAVCGCAILVQNGADLIQDNRYFWLGALVLLLLTAVAGISDTGYREMLLTVGLTDYLENSGAVRSEAGKVMAAKLKGKAASEFMKMNRRYDKICAAKGHFS